MEHVRAFIARVTQSRAIWVTAAIVAGLTVGLVIATAISPTEPVTDTNAGVGDVSATVPVAAPDMAKFPPGVPRLTLATGSTVNDTDRTVTLGDVTVSVTDWTCDADTVVSWSRPGGGAYCVLAVTYGTTGLDPVAVTSVNQLVYGVPAVYGAPAGYQGSFFLDKDSNPMVSVPVRADSPVSVSLVVDVQDGFQATLFVPQAR